jgi:hypothetical protein
VSLAPGNSTDLSALFSSLAVANIDNPSTELNARAGTTGAQVTVYQSVVGANEYTFYAFDSASTATVNAPYVIAASGSGQWIAAGGKYLNSGINAVGKSSLSGAANANSAVTVAATNPLTGTSQFGILSDFRGTSAATVTARAGFFRGGTAAAVFTCPEVTSLLIGNNVIGAGSTATRAFGLVINPQTGGTNNYGLAHTSAPTSDIAGNWFLYDDGGYKSTLSGPLLINTTTDNGAYKLQVSGTAGATAGVDTGASAWDQTNPGSSLVVGRSGTTALANTTCAFVGWLDATHPLNASAVNGELGLISRPVAGLSFVTNNAIRGRVTTGGNWIIGTTTDNGLGKLQVTGNVSATGTVLAGDFDVTTNSNGYNFGHDTVSKFMTIGYGSIGTTNFGDVRIYDGKTSTVALFAGATKSATFYGTMTGAAVATTQLILDRQDSGSERAMTFTNTGAASKYNFKIGCNVNVNDALEIIPSTAAAGSTYSVPAITIAGATRQVTIGAANGTNSLVVGGASGQYCCLLNGNGTLNNSFGPNINAGSSSSDLALIIADRTGSTTYLTVRGDGLFTAPLRTSLGGQSGGSAAATLAISGNGGTGQPGYYGILIDPTTLPTTSTTSATGAAVLLTLPASAGAYALVMGTDISAHVTASGSTITRAVGSHYYPQSAASNNCDILIGSSPSTFTGNWAIRSESSSAVYFAGNVYHAGGVAAGAISIVSAAGTSGLGQTNFAVIVTGSTTQTLTLPAANLYGANFSQPVFIKNESSGVVTVQRAGSDTIYTTASVTSFTLAAGTSAMLVADGVSKWSRIV